MFTDYKCVRNAADEIDQKRRMPRAEQSPAELEGIQSPRGVYLYCDGSYKTKWVATRQGLQPARRVPTHSKRSASESESRNVGTTGTWIVSKGIRFHKPLSGFNHSMHTIRSIPFGWHKTMSDTRKSST